MITGCKRSEKPNEIGGGILADDVGLGKTLTMLSAIIRTADEAKAFSDHSLMDCTSSIEVKLVCSRATLAMVPTPCKSFEYLKRISTNHKNSADSRMGTRNLLVS
jgi:hypothetical protein